MAHRPMNFISKLDLASRRTRLLLEEYNAEDLFEQLSGNNDDLRVTNVNTDKLTVDFEIGNSIVARFKLVDFMFYEDGTLPDATEEDEEEVEGVSELESANDALSMETDDPDLMKLQDSARKHIESLRKSFEERTKL